MQNTLYVLGKCNLDDEQHFPKADPVNCPWHNQHSFHKGGDSNDIVILPPTSLLYNTYFWVRLKNVGKKTR